MDTLVSHPQLKNRIFGAILLVILAVLLIPLFLGEPRNSLESIEQAQKAEFQSKIQPLPEGGERIKPEVLESLDSQTLDATDSKSDNATGRVLKTVGMPKTLDAQQTAKVESTNNESVANEPKVEPKKTVVAKQEAPNKQAAEVIKEGWALQVDMFSKKENAASMMKILGKHDFEPNSNLTQASFGEATRVWLGPFESKDQAEKVSAKLKAITGKDDYIVPYPFNID